MEKLKVGIIGAGGIAAKMAATLNGMDTAELWAIASRDEQRAKAFAARHGAAKAYGSYEALAGDPEVRLVYIATPNTFHRPHALLCLEHGKHVLCEKPFTVTSAEAREVFALAKSRRLVAAEAMWTRYLPFMATLRKVVDSGVIGKVVFIDANIGHDIKHVDRLVQPSLGGGALLDLGVYALNFAAAFLDERPSKIVSSRVRHATGVDAQNTVALSYPSGAMAALSSTMMTATSTFGTVYGEKGYIVVENILNPPRALRHSSDLKLVEILTAPEQITGFEYEVRAVDGAIRAGLDECPAFPHASTLEILAQMEEIQRQW